jgi:nucleoside-diphosphate-sugar epimerase
LQALKGGPIKLAHPESLRDWTFIEDTVRAFMLAGQASDVNGRVINVGTGISVRVALIARMVMASLGIRTAIIDDPERERRGNSEVTFLCADNGKAKQLLGWEPQITLEDGLTQTIGWFKESASYYPRAGHFTI